MRLSPDAARKYSAPRPSPVTTRRTAVLMPTPPFGRRSDTPSSSRVRSASASSAAASPRWTTRPASRTTTVSAMRRTSGQVLLDEEDRRGLGDPREHVGDLGDELRGQALGRLVDEEEHVVPQQHPREGDHLLLPTREGAGPLLPSGDEVGEQLADHRRTRADVATDEPEVLVHGQATEHVAVLGHVADPAANQLERLASLDVVPLQHDPAAPRSEAEDRLERRGLADAVASEQRGDAARGHLEGDALEDVRPAVVDVEVLDGEHGRPVVTGPRPGRPAGRARRR